MHHGRRTLLVNLKSSDRYWVCASFIPGDVPEEDARCGRELAVETIDLVMAIENITEPMDIENITEPIENTVIVTEPIENTFIDTEPIENTEADQMQNAVAILHALAEDNMRDDFVRDQFRTLRHIAALN